ncbi:hypothetical protein G6011_05479 [Alternaria panax]|uniref:Uncharacterized protein n=1 Tax=Alternaria panax TaxID=48097 RepID=A0AAD4FEV1_9PLEO|nr:hypothetical protein G6011_05479 [Alternaria panax]
MAINALYELKCKPPQLQTSKEAIKAFLLAVLASTAKAHTIFQKVSVNGVDQGQLKGFRAPDSDYPITSVTDAAFACNKDIKHKDTAVISIPTGAKVGAWWEC